MLSIAALILSASGTPATVCAAPQLQGSAPIVFGQTVSALVADFNRERAGPALSLIAPFGPPVGSLDPALSSFLEGRAAFAFLTRDIAEADLATFRRWHGGADPVVVPVAGGAWDRFGYVDAVAVIVNRANPVRRLSFRQLDAIFSTTRLRGGAPAHFWQSVGVPEWRGLPIHIVGGGAWSGQESARALTIRRRVLSVGGIKGAWLTAPDSGTEAETVDRVAADPLAIGFTGAGHLKPGVRAVAIAYRGRARLPTAATIAADRYPLARTVDLLLAPRPACPQAVAEFTTYLLGRRGQSMVARSGPFLALAAPTRRAAHRVIARAFRWYRR